MVTPDAVVHDTDGHAFCIRSGRKDQRQSEGPAEIGPSGTVFTVAEIVISAAKNDTTVIMVVRILPVDISVVFLGHLFLSCCSVVSITGLPCGMDIFIYHISNDSVTSVVGELQ